MQASPKISVVMSVYNCEEYVGKTIESVLSQTFRDFEFIIINDNSKDKSAEIIQGYADRDPRIIFIDSKENKGQCANLDYGYSIARGKYIAHTDHDDISYPDRLQVQYDYMEDHADVILSASNIDYVKGEKIIHDKNIIFGDLKTPELRFLLPICNVMAHSSFFMRTEAVKKGQLKYRDWKYCEDFYMALSALNCGGEYWHSRPLIAYRISENQVTSTVGDMVRDDEIMQVRKQYLDEPAGQSAAKGILKAIKGEFEKTEDFNALYDYLYKYAVYTGAINDGDKVQENEMFKFAFIELLFMQGISRQNLMRVMKSEREVRKLLSSRLGLSYKVQCVLKGK